MKKIKYGLTTALILLGLMACQDDFLEVDNEVAVDPEVAITNEAQLDGALLGVYNAMQSSITFGSDFVSIQAMLGDNGFVSINNSNRFTDVNRYEHALTESSRVSNIWIMLYRTIARVNFLLSKEGEIDDSEGVDGTPEEKFAEAKIARALALFNLVNYYARPYGTTSQELGVPIPLEYELNVPLARNTVEQVYNQIEQDLLYAIEYSVDGNQSRLGKTAATILLSRVYLFKKDYPKARAYSEMALSSPNASLLSITDIEDYYTDNNNSKETIFRIDFNENDNPGSNDALIATWNVTGTYSQNYATQEFYNLIPSTDARKSLYSIVESAADNPKPVNVSKYKSQDQDVVVVRTTEAKLNQIEALYYIDESLAQTELNNWVSTYRDEAYNTTATGQALLNEILTQRRVELAFEGHRFFDLNRYEMPVVKGANCTINCNVPFDDYKRVFPIPQYEMLANPLMQGNQNPGY